MGWKEGCPIFSSITYRGLSINEMWFLIFFFQCSCDLRASKRQSRVGPPACRFVHCRPMFLFDPSSTRVLFFSSKEVVSRLLTKFYLHIWKFKVYLLKFNSLFFICNNNTAIGQNYEAGAEINWQPIRV